MTSEGAIQFFDVLRQKCWKIRKGPSFSAPGVSTFGFFGSVKEKAWHFEVFLIFWSLRFGADLGRSLLVVTLIDQRWCKDHFDGHRCPGLVLQGSFLPNNPPPPPTNHQRIEKIEKSLVEVILTRIVVACLVGVSSRYLPSGWVKQFVLRQGERVRSGCQGLKYRLVVVAISDGHCHLKRTHVYSYILLICIYIYILTNI